MYINHRGRWCHQSQADLLLTLSLMVVLRLRGWRRQETSSPPWREDCGEASWVCPLPEPSRVECGSVTVPQHSFIRSFILVTHLRRVSRGAQNCVPGTCLVSQMLLLPCRVSRMVREGPQKCLSYDERIAELDTVNEEPASLPVHSTALALDFSTASVRKPRPFASCLRPMVTCM